MSDEGPLDILLEDGPVLVVNKPTGLLTQAPPGIDSLVVRTKEYLKQRYEKSGNVYLGVPHRLDRSVSGAVVFARNSKAAARLAEQFRERQVKKVYWGWVQGIVSPKQGTLKHWIKKIPDVSQATVCESTDEGAKEAVLDYRVLCSDETNTFVEVDLLTGRFHQIRVQFAAEGHPILGDALYGSSQQSFPASPCSGEDSPIALFARTLRFLHPVRYDQVEATAPLPGDWPSVNLPE